MKITNRHGLPAITENALKMDIFDPRNYPLNILWLTTLIGPPLPGILKRAHFEELIIDITDMAFRFIGSAVHDMIWKRAIKNQKNLSIFAEEKVYLEVETMEIITLPVGQTLWKDYDKFSEDKLYVSIKMDCYDYEAQSVDDHKVTSKWSYILEDSGVKPDTVAQLNVAGYVIRKLGFPVKTARVNYWFRDWSASEAAKQANYPPAPIYTQHNVPIWTDAACEEYIRERVIVHTTALSRDNVEDVVACSPSERWEKPTTYAVMKAGNKRAAKVCGSREAADRYIVDNSVKGAYVDLRPGSNVRCERFCECNKWCHFYKKLGGE